MNMNLHIFPAILLAIVAAPSFAQDNAATPLSELTLDLDRLATTPAQRYTYTAKSPGSGKVVGQGIVTFGTKVEGETVVLHDTMELTYRGAKLSLETTYHCRRDNFLSPYKIESKGQGSDEFKSFLATIADGRAKVEIDGQERTIDLPPQTVSFSALVRLITLLPRDQGARVSFPYWLESSELNLKKDFVIECLGQEEITHGDQPLPCTKFRLTSSQIMPTDAWVDDDGILQRLLIDGRKLIDRVAP